MFMNTKPKRGLRSFYPTDKGPIDLYQLGHDGRIEFLSADISTDHMIRGINTTDDWRKWARERGLPSDEVGLIVSKRLGGSGIDVVNLFPKSSSLDKTSWGTDEEKAYKEASEMKKWKKLKFFAKFEYPEDDSLRPSEIEYQYELPSGTKLYGKVLNKVESTSPPDPTTTKEKVGEEEEEESEYEYEYEEEEEEPEETPPQVPAPQQSNQKELSPKKDDLPPSPPPVVPPSSNSNVPTSTPPAEAAPAPVQVLRKRTPSPVPAKISEKVEPTPTIPPPAAPDKDATKPKEVSVSKDNNLVSPDTDRGMQVYGIVARSDLIEMLPVIGSVKLALDTLKAVSNKDTKRTLWKGVQCGISLFADFHFMRAFVRYGPILAKPITEKKLVRFANKAEPHLIIFVVCKIGNQLFSVIRRVLSNTKT